MNNRKKGQVLPRFLIYLLGLLIMSLGIVLFIKAELGATPWDVLHVGLYYKLGLTIGSWSIIMGIVILTTAALISKEFPQIGAFLNMILVGLFIDMFYHMPILQTPDNMSGKIIMFVIAIIINGYGMGLYISARFGAGPRDSLMLALSSRTHWKVQNVRISLEIIVLLIGWRLGGPIFWGTIIYGVAIGALSGICLPQCQRLTDFLLAKLKKKEQIQTQIDANRGANL